MSKVTYKELQATFPEEKKSVESIYGRIVPIRKISYWFTIPLLRINMSAFGASIVSLFIALMACCLLSVPNNICRIIGVILVPIWHIFDCVDGNIARYTKTSSDFGSAVDAICGYFIDSFLPISLGIAGYNIGKVYFEIHPVMFLILGGLGAISCTLAKLIHQKYAYEAKCVEEKSDIIIEKGDDQYHLTGFHKMRKMIQVNFGVVGFPMFALWLCPFFNCYALLAAYYGVYYIASLVLSTVYYLKKCKG